jgi:3-oxoacyl-[acyl-carrier protein] reductase|tara:strand:+ start:2044 stop:2793 length:750 start_codon:yes stop_codon:yes gene_type:complete
MLKNKRILITGANGTIGNSICKTFLKNNANLVLFYNNNSDNIDELKRESNPLKQEIESFQVDLSDINKIKKTMNEVLKTKSIDIFIHSVSLPLKIKKIVDCDWKEFEEHINLQTRSFFEISKAIIPGMKTKKNGKIVNILTSSVIGSPPNMLSSYVTAKHSSLGLSKSLAVELGSYGINVNCVSPSLIDDSLTSFMPSKLKEIIISQTPMKRLAKPLDVTNTVLFLCSNLSDFITGENIVISGGQSTHQ